MGLKELIGLAGGKNLLEILHAGGELLRKIGKLGFADFRWQATLDGAEVPVTAYHMQGDLSQPKERLKTTLTAGGDTYVGHCQVKDLADGDQEPNDPDEKLSRDDHYLDGPSVVLDVDTHWTSVVLEIGFSWVENGAAHRLYARGVHSLF